MGKLYRLILLFFICCMALIASAVMFEVRAQNVELRTAPVQSLGDPNAQVTIEVFNDYQCPPCARFNNVLQDIASEYRGRVRIIFRNMPLTSIHRNALAAAAAAEAAGMQGKFIEMINLLYARLEQWHETDDVARLFILYASELGLDTDRFARDKEGEEVRERIRRDIERAHSLRVIGTPTVFVNGKEISLPTEENMLHAINEALRGTVP